MGASNTGTNGKKNIEEIVKKDSVIRKLLDRDEVVEYISYKKGMIYKLFMTFFFIGGIGIVNQNLVGGKGIFDLIMVILGFIIFPLSIFIDGYISKFVVTNKGIIIRRAIKSKISDNVFCTNKFYYSEIKETGWSDFRFRPHIYIKIKNKKYHRRIYPLGLGIKEKEAKLLTQMIENKLKGVE